MEQENIHIVKSIFEAFGRGDIPALLTFVAEDVHWELPGPEVVPFCGARRGHEGVAEFFRRIGENLEFERFEVHDFIAQADKVVVLGGERARVKSTGKAYDNEWAMVFTISEGLVRRFFSYENTAVMQDGFSS